MGCGKVKGQKWRSLIIVADTSGFALLTFSVGLWGFFKSLDRRP